MSTEERKRLYEQLATAVFEGDAKLTKILAQEALDRNYDAWNAIERGLLEGLNRAEEELARDLRIAAEAMLSGLAILRPHIETRHVSFKGRVVMGLIQGETEDIGKALARIALEIAGFEVHDLGRDVPPRSFVDAAVALNADVIALTTRTVATMARMAEAVSILEAEQLRSRFKVIVLGSPLSQPFHDSVGADASASNAAQAVELTTRLVGLAKAA